METGLNIRMGRFSKLETGAAESPDDILRAKRPEELEDEGPQYDVLHWMNEGDRHFFHGDYQKALRMYSRAIQADHAAISPWIGQVLCLVEMKQFKEAMVWVKRGLELFPEEPRLISAQGVVYANEGMTQRGLGCSDAALHLSAADPLSWVLRGEILSLADNKNADFCFEKAMESTARDDWQIRMRIGILLLRQKKWAQAAEFLRAACELSTRNDYLWAKLGYAQEHLSFIQGAMDSYKTALAINPINSEAEQGLRRITRTNIIKRAWRRIFR